MNMAATNKHNINFLQNIPSFLSRDKFQPCHWPLVVYVALLGLYALRSVRIRLETALITSFQPREDVEWAKCRSNYACVERHDGVLSRPTGCIFRPFK